MRYEVNKLFCPAKNEKCLESPEFLFTPLPDTCATKFSLVLMREPAEGQACAEPGERDPIGASGNFTTLTTYVLQFTTQF